MCDYIPRIQRGSGFESWRDMALFRFVFTSLPSLQYRLINFKLHSFLLLTMAAAVQVSIAIRCTGLKRAGELVVGGTVTQNNVI